MPCHNVLEREKTHSLWMLAFYVCCFPFVTALQAQANFASRFSIATGELYSDNILFSQDKQSDFVTLLAPTLSLAYKPSGYPEPTFNVSLSSPVEIFARHSELNNIGDNVGLNANYLYPYSPRLEFTFTERLQRRGASRTGGLGNQDGGGIGLGGLGGGGRGGTGGGRGLEGMVGLGDFGSSAGLSVGGESSCRRISASGRSGGVSQGSGDLVTAGELLENEVGGDVRFQYSKNLSFQGGYCWESVWFFGEGGKETSHSFSVGGEYKLWRQHTLRVRYTVSLLRSRNGQDDLVHDFDFGNDFLGGLLGEVIPTQKEIYLTPTLSVRASTGIAVQTSGGGNSGSSGSSKFGLEHKLDLDVIKVWRTANLTLGVHRGFTGSFGVSGPSFTTEFFTRFSWQLSQRLAVSTGAEFALFDADQADFTTFQALLGLQYWLTNWLSTNLAYSYSWAESQNGTLATGALGRGKIASNTVFLSFSTHFDVWPHFGLAKEGSRSLMGPALHSPSRRSSSRRSP
jgi:hypothetical protein